MGWIEQGRQEHGWFGHGTKERLLRGAVRNDKPTYKGEWYVRPDATEFGVRMSKRFGETLDTKPTGASNNVKVHWK